MPTASDSDRPVWLLTDRGRVWTPAKLPAGQTVTHWCREGGEWQTVERGERADDRTRAGSDRRMKRGKK